jgi:hypothetical protein
MTLYSSTASMALWPTTAENREQDMTYTTLPKFLALRGYTETDTSI